MSKLTEEQLRRRELKRTITKAIELATLNLKWRMLNEIEPEILAEFDERTANGLPYQFDMRDAVGEVEARLLKATRKAMP